MSATVALLLVAALGASSCSSSGGAGGAEGSKPTLTIGINAGPVSLDPSKDSFTFGAVRPLTNAFLTHQAPDGSIQPWLAQSWRYLGKGNKDFELTLRRGTRFSDGNPVTAEAVKTWLEYFADGSSVFAATMGAIESIETVGGRTVRLHLEKPNPIIPYLLSENGNWGAISSPAAVKKPSILGTETAGAGPYVLDPSQSVTDQTYTLMPNEHYYDRPAIKFGKVVVKVISDPTALLQAARTGQVDVVVGGDLSTADAAKSAGLDVLGVPSNTRGLVLADRAKGPLGDVRVRQALNYAVDRKTITQGLVGKHGTPTSQMSSLDGADPEYQDYYAYDLAKAKSLLAAAGHADGLKLNVLEFGGVGKVGTPLAQAIASYWAKAGVTANVVSAPSPAEFVEKRKTNKYPIVYYSVDNSSMYVAYKLAMSPTGGLNPFGADDPVMNDLFEKGARSSDPTRFWKQMGQRTVTEAYFLPVFNSPIFYYVSDKVQGVELTKERPSQTWATEWSPR